MTDSGNETRQREEQAPFPSPDERMTCRQPETGGVEHRLRTAAALLCADCQLVSPTGRCIHGHRCIAELIFEILDGDLDPLGLREDCSRRLGFAALSPTVELMVPACSEPQPKTVRSTGYLLVGPVETG